MKNNNNDDSQVSVGRKPYTLHQKEKKKKIRLIAIRIIKALERYLPRPLGLYYEATPVDHLSMLQLLFFFLLPSLLLLLLLFLWPNAFVTILLFFN